MEHTVPTSSVISGYTFYFERDTRDAPATREGHDGWTVKTVVDGHEYLLGLHYAPGKGYSAAGKVRHHQTWQGAMESDGVASVRAGVERRRKHHEG